MYYIYTCLGPCGIWGRGVFIIYIAGSKVSRIDLTSGTAQPSFPEFRKVLITIQLYGFKSAETIFLRPYPLKVLITIQQCRDNLQCFKDNSHKYFAINSSVEVSRDSHTTKMYGIKILLQFCQIGSFLCRNLRDFIWYRSYCTHCVPGCNSGE